MNRTRNLVPEMTNCYEQLEAAVSSPHDALRDLAALPARIGRKRVDRMRAILAQFPGVESEVSLDQLIAALGVSGSTIRRDLAELADRGLIRRSYGGARLAEAPDELPVHLRGSDQARAKKLIARKAATLVPARGPIAIATNGGTTTLEVIRALRYRDDLTLITNSLPMAVEAAAWPGARVIMTGGVVRARSLEATGSLTESAFSSVHVTAAFVGADGVSAEGGATTHHYGEGRSGLAIATHARRVIVVADSSKIGKMTLAPIVGLEQVNDLVTDADADAGELDAIRARGVAVHVVTVRSDAGDLAS
jgi:DeoR family transcriptional regulator of aga operon